MAWLWVGLLVGTWLPAADDPAPGRRAEVEETWRKRLEPTQFAVRLVDDRGGVRFRATLVARSDDTLVLLTAAHCVEPGDRGRRLELRQGEQTAVLTIASVSINPWRAPDLPDAIPGSDNAMIIIRTPPPESDTTAWLSKSTRVARLAASPTPGRDGSTIPVFAIDQFEKPHLVRAGNFTNPRWLEWGKTYQPIPGDSGSGVFGFISGRDDEIEAVLIGVVTDKSPNGGGASVVAASDEWVAAVLATRGRSRAPEAPAQPPR